MITSFRLSGSPDLFSSHPQLSKIFKKEKENEIELCKEMIHDSLPAINIFKRLLSDKKRFTSTSQSTLQGNPVVSRACLGWASSRPPRTRFATPQIWNGVLCSFKYMATTFITVAICISIFQLRFACELEGSGENSDLPAYSDVRPAAG